jgi:hypothetical protein
MHSIEGDYKTTLFLNVGQKLRGSNARIQEETFQRGFYRRK